MASASATATMAAAGFDKRTSTSSSLQTPGSGTFPSELRSPSAGSPGLMLLRDNDLKTPITPPSAYLDFLKNMTPAMMSPAPTSTSARFSFNERSSDKASQTPTEKPSISPPTSQPALSRNTSYDSNASSASSSSISSTVSSISDASTAKGRPELPRVSIPSSAFAKPAPRSARTPRRLHIPQSPAFSPVPGSAHSLASPYVSTPLSSAPWSASFESREVNPDTNAQPGKVSVKQVVTRTVTYCRTPLEPAPNGNLWKRRKIEHEETTPKALTAEPAVKEETPGDIISETSTESAPSNKTTPSLESTPSSDSAPSKDPKDA